MSQDSRLEGESQVWRSSVELVAITTQVRVQIHTNTDTDIDTDADIDEDVGTARSATVLQCHKRMIGV